MNRIVLLAALSLALAPVSRAAEPLAKMETRMYQQAPRLMDMATEDLSKRGGSTRDMLVMGESSRDLSEIVDYRKSKASAALRKYLEGYGLKFVDGAYAFYDPSWSAVVMRNTSAQHAKLRKLLVLWNCLPSQITIDASMVSFARTEIETLARKQVAAAPAPADLLAAWKAGKGRLLATQTLTTRSGVNAQMQGVNEIIFPTEFSSPADVPTNSPERVGTFLITPGLFETREVGYILNFTPTLGPDGKTIDLVLAPELSLLAGTNSFAAVFGSTGSVSQLTQSRVEQPVFQTGKVTTSVVMRDGSTVVLGDLASPGSPEHWYLFLTARVIDSAGAPPGENDYSILIDDEPAAP